MGKAFWRALAGDLICWDESQAAGWQSGYLQDREGDGMVTLTWAPQEWIVRTEADTLSYLKYQRVWPLRLATRELVIWIIWV